MIDLSSVDFVELLERLGLSNAHMTAGGIEVNYSCHRSSHSNGDNRPSAYINSTTGAFMCQGCHFSGSVVALVADVQQVSKPEAERWLRESFGVQFKEPIGGSLLVEMEVRLRPPASKPIITRPPESWLSSVRLDWYTDDLAPYQRYMLDRGLSRETLTDAQIGYDYLSDRLTIPVRALDGSLYGVKGRDWCGSHPAKYLVVGDRLGSNRLRYGFGTYEVSEVVFGLHRAREYKTVVLVEGECFTGDTQVLTTSGWVNLNEYEGQYVCQYEDSGTLRFVEPTNIIRKNFIGDLVSWSTDRLGEISLTTPDHMMVAEDRASGRVFKHKACVAPYVHNLVPRVGHIDQDPIDLTDDQLRFFVAVSADSSLRDYSTGVYTVFGFKKERKTARIREIIDRLGISYTPGRSGDHEYTYTYLPGWCPHTKIFPHEWLSSLSLHQRKIILDELPHWDGTYHPNRNEDRYATSIYENAVFVQTLAHTTGCCSTIMNKKNRLGKWFDVSILKSKTHNSWQSMKRSDVPYDGEVFCLSVPSGMLLIRHDRNISISGNCDTMALRQMGVARPIATGSSQMSRRQARLIIDEAEEVVVFYDVGAAGENGTRQVVELLEPHVRVKIARPLEVDPCDALRFGCQMDVLRAIERAESSLVLI